MSAIDSEDYKKGFADGVHMALKEVHNLNVRAAAAIKADILEVQYYKIVTTVLGTVFDRIKENVTTK